MPSEHVRCSVESSVVSSRGGVTRLVCQHSASSGTRLAQAVRLPRPTLVHRALAATSNVAARHDYAYSTTTRLSHASTRRRTNRRPSSILIGGGKPNLAADVVANEPTAV